jgi:hypothetical protein
MGRRPRLSVFGTVGVIVALALGALILLSPHSEAGPVVDVDVDATSPDAVSGSLVVGVVSADGVLEPPETPAGWTIEHPEPGRYLLTVLEPGVVVDVVSWDVVADVVVVPGSGGVTELRFDHAGEGVDTRFIVAARAAG